jgi:hypothetical protein
MVVPANHPGSPAKIRLIIAQHGAGSAIDGDRLSHVTHTELNRAQNDWALDGGNSDFRNRSLRLKN